MTQPGEVRVTVARVCPRCYGTEMDWPLTCLRCDGAGVVWEPVTCSDCAHSAHAGPNLFCDLLGREVEPGFACRAWTPLMVISEPRS